MTADPACNALATRGKQEHDDRHVTFVVDIVADASSNALETTSELQQAQSTDDVTPGRGLSYDEALTDHVGEFGRGQLINFMLAGLVWIPNAVLILLLVFSLGSPVQDRDWTCVNPSDAACTAVLASGNPTMAGFCSMTRDQWAWALPHATLIAQFDLICNNAYKTQIANSLFFVGYLIGSGTFGQLSDRFGRKACLFSAAVISAVFSAAGTACTSYWSWLSMRLMAGVGASGTSLGAYVLATESIGPKWRGAAGIATQIFFVAGEFVLVLITVLFPSWRGQGASAAVLSGALLLLWGLLPESGRWLLAQGRKDEAVKVLERLALRNSTSAPEQPLADMDHGAGQGQRLTLRAALRDWHIARRFFVLSYAWMVMCMAYYGISFALGGLGGSLRVSVILSALAELPSYIFTAVAIDRLGRHNTMAGCMLLGGAALVGCAFMPPGGSQIALASVGKFGISGAFAIASIYTSELFPTLIRSAVLGVENQAARVGAIVSPFIVLAGVERSSSLIPFLTFGAAALVAGLLIFTLPETLGVPLPDTMADMHVIASIFTHETLAKKGFKAAATSMFKTRVKLTTGGTQQIKQQGDPQTEERQLQHGIRGWLRSGKGSMGDGAGKLQQHSIWEEDEVGPADAEVGVSITTGGSAAKGALESNETTCGCQRSSCPEVCGGNPGSGCSRCSSGGVDGSGCAFHCGGGGSSSSCGRSGGSSSGHGPK